jgi:hypothetical protein
VILHPGIGQPTRIGWEQPYSDGSGAEFGVELRDRKIRIESHGGVAEFPQEEIVWLIAALTAIREHLDQ